MQYNSLIADLEKWLAMQTLADVPPQEIIPALCAQLRDGGVPVSRVSMGWRLLHPLYRAEDFTWDRLGDSIGRRFLYSSQDTDRFRRSPLFHVLSTGVDVFRRRIGDPAVRREFEIFDELASCGHSDYLLTLVAFGTSGIGDPLASYDEDRGVFISFCSDAPDGFDDAQVGLLTRLRYMIAIAARSTIHSEIASAIATTYLGRRAGRQVLAGSIRRGDGEIIPAVIWYSDLRGSTALSERLDPQAYVAFLNEYFEATAGAVDDAGGEILDFIGDGVLAIFSQDDGGVPSALRATADALARLDRLAASRPEIAGGNATLAGIAIAGGDVLFGNIGIPERLTFSVIGTTVNSVARIEKLTKALGERVLVTRQVAACAPERFASRGWFELEGMQQPIELFGLAAAAATVAGGAADRLGTAAADAARSVAADR